ncbi:phloretin 4'-O-glucosyltransferase-like [Magnolia sinica]|uniref:phloretin 4'-O-glucosyltransferase-like n=1 Tax=Magnolia sinica TaxID=86752 RepID=UPI00265B2197|nr:phloretin 4'-O-glucosyltransferase-like [Magnolia sinica]
MAHFLLLSFPAQGHINPTVQLAKRLTRTGAHVTFATTVYAHRRMIKSTSLDGLSYASFSDGYDDGMKPTDSLKDYMLQFKDVGPRSVSDLIHTLADEGRPVTCVIYNLLLPWAADVASTLHIPSVLLWIQPAAVLAIYYHYFHGYDHLITSCKKDPTSSIELRGLPLLSVHDLPSFFGFRTNQPPVLHIYEELFRAMERESKPKVLVNTINALEGDAMKAVDKLDMIAIGPLIPSAFLDERETSDNAVGADLFQSSKNYVDWLDSKPASSVVYVSFGSTESLPENQMVEILNGLVESGRPFLWVIRPAENGAETDTDTEFWKNLIATEEIKQGLVVQWCSQVEVLSHPSVGCFMSHCGWNSVSESLALGVPMVGFPQWADQPTNIKMVESVWKAGVRARVNEDEVLEGGEVKRSLDLVMGGVEGEEMKKNAMKWRDLAMEAGGENGSLNKNIRAFVEEMTATRP